MRGLVNSVPLGAMDVHTTARVGLGEVSLTPAARLLAQVQSTDQRGVAGVGVHVFRVGEWRRVVEWLQDSGERPLAPPLRCTRTSRAR